MTTEENALKLVDSLGKNPETRRDFLGLIKKVNPNTHIPEIDNVKPVEDKLTKLSEDMGKIVRVLANDRQDRELEKKRSKLKSERGYTDDGLKAIEDFMVKHSIADHEIAADAMEARQPKAAPEMPSFSTRAFFDFENKDNAVDWTNPEAALDKELSNALNEFRSGGIRA